VNKFEVGLVLGLAIVLVSILIVGYTPFSPFSPFEGVWRQEIDIREEIEKLPTQNGGNYFILERDWSEWSSQMQDAGGDFTKMNTWEEFTGSLEHHDLAFLMLDETDKVVWYNPPFTVFSAESKTRVGCPKIK
jgi:hypothetical protein